MEKTRSESLFERYCGMKGIVCTRLPEAETRTPDYEIAVGSERIVVEVKEILPTPEEEKADRLRRERGYGTVVSTPGDRVRKKIKASSGQIRARTSGMQPGILVLCYLGIYGHIEPYNIRVAMYGLEQIHIALPPFGIDSPYVTGMGYGPKRKMTEEDNTSISVIGALFIPRPDQLVLHVYHNKYAQAPLDLSLLAQYDIPQFELENAASGTTAKWREVGLTDEH